MFFCFFLFWCIDLTQQGLEKNKSFQLLTFGFLPPFSCFFSQGHLCTRFGAIILLGFSAFFLAFSFLVFWFSDNRAWKTKVFSFYFFWLSSSFLPLLLTGPLFNRFGAIFLDEILLFFCFFLFFVFWFDTTGPWKKQRFPAFNFWFSSSFLLFLLAGPPVHQVWGQNFKWDFVVFCLFPFLGFDFQTTGPEKRRLSAFYFRLSSSFLLLLLTGPLLTCLGPFFLMRFCCFLLFPFLGFWFLHNRALKNTDFQLCILGFLPPSYCSSQGPLFKRFTAIFYWLFPSFLCFIFFGHLFPTGCYNVRHYAQIFAREKCEEFELNNLSIQTLHTFPCQKFGHSDVKATRLA